MKKSLFICLLLASSIAFSQSNKSDKKNEIKQTNCGLAEDFKEPKSSKKVLRWLKKFDATTDDLKSHVAVENDVEESKVILIRISEQRGNGMYILCVDGKKMKYRRMGSVFSRLDEKLFDGN